MGVPQRVGGGGSMSFLSVRIPFALSPRRLLLVAMPCTLGTGPPRRLLSRGLRRSARFLTPHRSHVTGSGAWEAGPCVLSVISAAGWRGDGTFLSLLPLITPLLIYSGKRRVLSGSVRSLGWRVSEIVRRRRQAMPPPPSPHSCRTRRRTAAELARAHGAALLRRDPHEGVFGFLDACRPLREVQRAYIASGGRVRARCRGSRSSPGPARRRAAAELARAHRAGIGRALQTPPQGRNCRL